MSFNVTLKNKYGLFNICALDISANAPTRKKVASPLNSFAPLAPWAGSIKKLIKSINKVA